MSHTPGPWETSGQLIVGQPEPFNNPKSMPLGKKVAIVCWDYEGDLDASEPRIKWTPEGQANLRLIAAAPELLATLKQLVIEIGTLCTTYCLPETELLDEVPEFVEAVNRADELLQSLKAKGGS